MKVKEKQIKKIIPKQIKKIVNNKKPKPLEQRIVLITNYK